MASHVFNNAGMLLHFLRELNMNLSWDTTSVWILALEPILSAQCNLESVSFTQAVIKTQPWLDACSLREAGYCLALSLWNTSTFSLYGPVCFCAGGVDGWAVGESWYKSWQQLRSLRYLVFIVVYKSVLMGILKLLLTSPHTEMTLVEMFVCWELECLSFAHQGASLIRCLILVPCPRLLRSRIHIKVNPLRTSAESWAVVDQLL